MNINYEKPVLKGGVIAWNLTQVTVAIAKIMQQYLDVLNQKWNKNYPLPRIDLSKIKSTDGKAGMADPNTYTVHFNYALLSRNFNEFVTRTIPHELCHLIAHQLYPRLLDPHGREWQGLMVTLGCDSTKCHSYDISAIMANRGVLTYPYNCLCRKGGKRDGALIVYPIKAANHQKIQAGQGTMTCRKCKAPLKWVDAKEQPKQEAPGRKFRRMIDGTIKYLD